MLQIENLNAHYGGQEVLSGLSFTLERGRIHALIGPSGCGKSTLLKILCGIHRHYSGAVLFDGQPLNKKTGMAGAGSAAIRIGYVPQNYGLLPWKTVLDNILLPLRITKPSGHKNHSGCLQIGDFAPRARKPGLFAKEVYSSGTRPERKGPADAAIGQKNNLENIIFNLGLTEVLDRYPRELSGGQQQRAALARAFALTPDLLLMDEPFSALDAFTAEKSQQLFLGLWQDFPVTTLFITHNMREAALLGQRILLMSGVPGRIADKLDNPAFALRDGADKQDGVNGEEQDASRLGLITKMSDFFFTESGA